MKRLYNALSLLGFLFLTINGTAQIFVNASASGSNDGSSWANAYNNVYDAVAAASEGDQLWLATGSYPAGLTRDDWMMPTVNVQIYGGFLGTESNLADRDYQNNITIITGDLSGDDIENNFVMNKTDNSKHIMWLDTFITNMTILDGLTFSNGHTDDGTAAGNDRRAGGILSYGAPIVRNCRFTQNYGYFASSLYPRLMYASGTKVENCMFDHNAAENGGAIYLVTANDIEIRNCTYNNNEAEARGGAIYQSASNVLYEDCVFEINSARTTGGSMHITNSTDDSNTSLLTRCSFNNNSAFGGWGGAITVYGDSASVHQISFLECGFDINNCARSGGAMSVGFGAEVNIEDCTFTGNSSTESGGAIFGQNDSTKLNFIGNTFEFNTAVTSGGAINAGGGQYTTIDDCFFNQNTAATGGAINTNEDILDISFLGLDNSIFLQNIAENQGGAINLGNTKTHMTSCLLQNNVANGTGTGGALSNNVGGTDIDTVTIINSTFAQNNGTLASGIAQWTDPATTASAVLIMLNTINQNADLDYAVEDGTPTLISSGGNMAHDNSMETAFVTTNDENLISANFTTEYRLENGSPGVNTGVNVGLNDAQIPEFDLDGNSRDAIADKGAYENQSFVGVNDLATHLSSVEIFPNPVKVITNLKISSELLGKHELVVVDFEGRIVTNTTFSKDAEKVEVSLNADTWSAGTYRVFIKTEGQIVGAQSLIVIK